MHQAIEKIRGGLVVSCQAYPGEPLRHPETMAQMAMAADMVFGASQQITFAKDLIVDNGTTIYAPAGLELRAQATDAAKMGTIAAGNTLQVKITLSNGAKFDSSAPAPALVAQFLEGVETGGAPAALAVRARRCRWSRRTRCNTWSTSKS